VLWVGPDSSVAFLVHSLDALRSDSIGDVLGKLLLVRILIITLQLLHVAGNVKAKDVLSVDISVVFVLSSIIAWESLGAIKFFNLMSKLI